MPDITTTSHENVLMIVVVGRIDSSNAHELGAALNAAIGEGRYQLVADL